MKTKCGMCIKRKKDSRAYMKWSEMKNERQISTRMGNFNARTMEKKDVENVNENWLSVFGLGWFEIKRELSMENSYYTNTHTDRYVLENYMYTHTKPDEWSAPNYGIKLNWFWYPTISFTDSFPLCEQPLSQNAFSNLIKLLFVLFGLFSPLSRFVCVCERVCAGVYEACLQACARMHASVRAFAHSLARPTN